VITCRELISFLLEYLDGALDEVERERFEAHLRVCASCTAYLRTYELTIRMGRAASMDDCDVPEDLVRAVMASRGAR
jgi:predicted anti-sigma-YlaC factor YlaD